MKWKAVRLLADPLSKLGFTMTIFTKYGINQQFQLKQETTNERKKKHKIGTKLDRRQGTNLDRR